MTLDDLYDKVKDAEFPINDREALQALLGDIRVEFRGDTFDARSIALEIRRYPIKDAADLIRDFILCFEEYNPKEGEELQDVMKE